MVTAAYRTVRLHLTVISSAPKTNRILLKILRVPSFSLKNFSDLEKLLFIYIYMQSNKIHNVVVMSKF